MFALQAINYANNQSRAKALLDELHNIPSTAPSGQSPRFESIQADVGDRAAIQKLVQETITKFGRLDVVVSNAGWTRVTNFQNLDEGMEDEDWDRCFLYNVKSHLWIMHASKAHLEETEGAFVTTASVAGVKPSGSSLPYSVTKAAAIHLSKALAVICSPKIRVNSVSPGLLLTEWGMKFGPEKIEKATEATKLKRLATVEVLQPRVLALRRQLTGDAGRGGPGTGARDDEVDDGPEPGGRQRYIALAVLCNDPDKGTKNDCQPREYEVQHLRQTATCTTFLKRVLLSSRQRICLFLHLPGDCRMLCRTTSFAPQRSLDTYQEHGERNLGHTGVYS